MMNPSKATHDDSDKTVDQLINKAKELNYDALYVVNVLPKICRRSKDLRMGDFNYDEINWFFISNSMLYSQLIFIGWGIIGQTGLKRQLKTNSSIANYFRLSINKICYYELLVSKNKNKYVPKYYVPHPRPIFGITKYEKSKFISFNSEDFSKLFVY